MRAQELTRFIETTPNRGRLALGLAIATHVASVRQQELQSNDPPLLDLVNRAIGLAWKWLEGQDVRAAELYMLFDQVAIEEGNIVEGELAKEILVVVGYALGMLVTEAYVLDKKRGLVADPDIPGDLSDFTEKDLQVVCDTAEPLLGAAADAVFQRFIERIATRTAGHSAADLGPDIPRRLLEE
jgi:hypothetical protein